MGLQKLFYVFPPFAKQNQAEGFKGSWSFCFELKVLMSQCLGPVVPLAMFLKRWKSPCKNTYLTTQVSESDPFPNVWESNWWTIFNCATFHFVYTTTTIVHYIIQIAWLSLNFKFFLVTLYFVVCLSVCKHWWHLTKSPLFQYMQA